MKQPGPAKGAPCNRLGGVVSTDAPVATLSDAPVATPNGINDLTPNPTVNHGCATVNHGGMLPNRSMARCWRWSAQIVYDCAVTAHQ